MSTVIVDSEHEISKESFDKMLSSPQAVGSLEKHANFRNYIGFQNYQIDFQGYQVNMDKKFFCSIIRCVCLSGKNRYTWSGKVKFIQVRAI